MQTELIEFVKNKKGAVGCVLATVITVGNDEHRQMGIGIGWSRCHLGKDIYDKQQAVHIARERASRGTSATLPRDVGRVVEKMKVRSLSYFKGQDLI